MSDDLSMHWPHCGVYGDGPCDAGCLVHETAAQPKGMTMQAINLGGGDLPIVERLERRCERYRNQIELERLIYRHAMRNDGSYFSEQ